MTLTEQVYAQAVLLAGDLENREDQLLRVLCAGAVSSLTARLREGIRPEDCRADFVASASLFALAALSGNTQMGRMERITAGDVTLHRSGPDAAANCLRYQAEVIISPYLKDNFSFQGV